MKRRIALLLAICLLGAGLAQAANEMPQLSAGHEKMLEWCGRATITGKTFTTSIGPGREIKGTWVGKPILGGFAIEGEYVYEGQGPNGETRGKEIVSYDPRTDKYTYTFLTNTGYRETAPFTQEGAVAAWQTPYVRDGKQYQLRGTDTDLPDGTGFVRREEISTDGQTWQPLHESKFVFSETPASSAEQELIKVDTAWGDYLLAGDVEGLDRILAEEYTCTGSSGDSWTKEQELADLRSGDLKLTSAVGEDLKVRVYGDMGVNTGIFVEKGQYKGRDTSGKYAFTDTWIKRDGRWQCVASHISKVSESANESLDTANLSPAMKKLAVMAGQWSYEGEQAAPPVAGLPYGGAGKFSGTVTARFVLDGHFLEEIIDDHNPGGTTRSVGMTGYDPQTKKYVANGFTSEGSRDRSVQTVSDDGLTWTSRSTTTTEDGKDVPMRSVFTYAPDGNSYTGTTEASPDNGQTWTLWYREQGKRQSK